jgi:hypothetical protein
MRVFSFLIALLAVTSLAYADRPQYQDIVLQNAVSATANGAQISVNQSNVVRLDVQITGTATVGFNIAGPGNYGWYSKLCTPSDSETAVTETTASGVFYCVVAAGNTVRAPVTAYTDGTVTVVGRATTAR